MLAKFFQWIKTRKRNKLEIKLAGKKEKLWFLDATCKGQKVSYYIIKEIAELREEIASLEKKIELL